MNSPGSTDTENTERKKRFRLVVRTRAKREIDAIGIYLEEQRRGARENFNERLFQVFGLLLEMPLMGRMARSTRMLRKGYRAFVVDAHIVYYKVKDDRVEVFAVVHGAREEKAEG